METTGNAETVRGAVLPGTCRETRMNVCDLHRCLDCPLLLPAFCHVESQREKHYILKQEKKTPGIQASYAWPSCFQKDALLDTLPW